jgi:hypothetical protein
MKTVNILQGGRKVGYNTRNVNTNNPFFICFMIMYSLTRLVSSEILLSLAVFLSALQ